MRLAWASELVSNRLRICVAKSSHCMTPSAWSRSYSDQQLSPGSNLDMASWAVTRSPRACMASSTAQSTCGVFTVVSASVRTVA